MNAAVRFAIDVTVRDFIAGTRKDLRLRKRYKTAAGAERAAQAIRWICRPDGVHATQEATATVSEVTK